MSEYAGPATITAPDAEPVPVTAFLFSTRDPATGLGVWGGRATVEPPATLWEAYNSIWAVLTIGDRSGDIIITSYGEESSELQGSGEPPF